MNNLKRKAKNKKGFTLIELIIVIVIIAILAAIAIPAVLGYIQKAKDSATKGEMQTIKSAVASTYAASQAGIMNKSTFEDELKENLGGDFTSHGAFSGGKGIVETSEAKYEYEISGSAVYVKKL